MTQLKTTKFSQVSSEPRLSFPLSSDDFPPLASHLSQFSRENMARMIQELARSHPEVERCVLDYRPEYPTDALYDTTHRLRQHILRLAGDAVESGEAVDESDISHVDTLHRSLVELANNSQADALLQVGEVLVRLGGQILERLTDTTMAVKALRECIRLVLSAVPASSLSPALQLSWLVDIHLEDDARLIHSDDVETLLDQTHYRKSDWQTISELLEIRLTQRVSVSMNNKGRRRKILAMLVDAYKRAGWSERILPLLTKELTNSQCYLLLVDALLDQGDADSARSCCIAGYRSVLKKSPDLANALRNRWCELSLADGKVHKVASCRAQAFFEYPTLESYQALKEAAQRARCWPAVRLATLAYLETGRRPDELYGPTSERWPLPTSEFKSKRPILKNNPLAQFPAWTKLIDIALLEERLDDIAALYRRMEPIGQFGVVKHKMAEALADSHPELAIEIHFSLAGARLTEARPQPKDSHYREAIEHLTRAFDISQVHEMESTWLHHVKHLLADFAFRSKLHGLLISFFRSTRSIAVLECIEVTSDET